MIDWLRNRIRAKPESLPLQVKPIDKKMKRELSPENTTAKKDDILSLFGVKKQPTVDPNKQWHELREGLKLQSIVNSKRMNEINFPTALDKKTCIITRHIGMQKFIPGSGQWQILTEPRDECWHCGQHNLALFIWSPRIG